MKNLIHRCYGCAGALLLLPLCGLIVFSCAEDGAREDYGPLTQTEQGLALTKAEHGTGWGKSECFLCHNKKNVHIELTDPSLEGVIDLKAIRLQVENNGIASCAACHGSNGI